MPRWRQLVVRIARAADARVPCVGLLGGRARGEDAGLTIGRWLIWEPIALEEARRRLSQRLGVPEARVSVTEVVRVEWPNACLGAADGDEVCAEVITPGFRIVLEARGQEQVYHSDLQSNVRRGPE